jgi:hypothetical protein
VATAENDPEPVNVHASWRMAVAKSAARAYAPNGRLAVFAVAGSVGSGLADRFSDLEVDCYWHEPPGDRDRRAPIERLGGQLEAFWEYDTGDEEWSEEYILGTLPVTISNFVVGTAERCLDAVTLQADTDPVKHMRLAAIQCSRPLHGAALLCGWQDRAGRYPDRLVTAMVEQSLAPDALPGWSAREALARRGDDIALHHLLVSVQRAVFGAVLALNRIYQPHRLAKWQRHLLGGLQVAPGQLSERLHGLWSAGSAAHAIAQAESLLTDTVDLAEATAQVSLGEFREVLAERRAALDPPRALS